MAEFISKESLKDALKKFRVRGDERWVSDERAEEVVVPVVDGYLEDAGSLDSSDIADILGMLGQ